MTVAERGCHARDGIRRGLFDLRKVEELCERSSGRRGARPLQSVLAEQFEPPRTRSDLERDFLDHCRPAGLPAPEVNVEVAGYEVDSVWHTQRLVVELDTRTFHERRPAFERDRVRDANLLLAGYRVARVTADASPKGGRASWQCYGRCSRVRHHELSDVRSLRSHR